jgi:hypothetical protein
MHRVDLLIETRDLCVACLLLEARDALDKLLPKVRSALGGILGPVLQADETSLDAAKSPLHRREPGLPRVEADLHGLEPLTQVAHVGLRAFHQPSGEDGPQAEGAVPSLFGKCL